MILFKQKKQTNLYKDFGHSEDVEKILEYTEIKYKKMLKMRNKGEINFFEGLNKISEEIASKFDLRIIELTELRLEYRFKNNLLLKFLYGALAVFAIQFISHPMSQILQAIFGYFASGVPQEKYRHIAYLGSFLALISVYFYIDRNDSINQIQRIIKYALILKRHQIGYNYLHQAQLAEL